MSQKNFLTHFAKRIEEIWTGSEENTDLLEYLFRTQKSFSSKFIDQENLSLEEKERLTQEFALALHNEVSSLVREINFKHHASERKDIVKNSILFEGIDCFRYLLAIMNLWGFTADEFLEAFDDKAAYLDIKYNNDKEWAGQPVVLVDVDDVVANFREGYADYLNSLDGVNVDVNSSEYYFTEGIPREKYNPELIFQDFIEARMLRTLTVDQSMISAVNDLYDKGYWIHVLTARPDWNQTCKYDTYTWLSNSGLKFHRISFSPEKMIWAAKSKYYDGNAIFCAIDDSPKHSREYAKHGVKVISPKKPYNSELESVDNVFVVKSADEVEAVIQNFNG